MKDANLPVFSDKELAWWLLYGHEIQNPPERLRKGGDPSCARQRAGNNGVTGARNLIEASANISSQGAAATLAGGEVGLSYSSRRKSPF